MRAQPVGSDGLLSLQPLVPCPGLGGFRADGQVSAINAAEIQLPPPRPAPFDPDACSEPLAQAAVDSLSVAIFMVDAERRIGLANRAGQQMLQPGGRLCMRHGVLSSPVAAETARMAQAVQRICAGRERRLAAVFEGGAGRQPLQMVLSRTTARLDLDGGREDAWALLLVGPSTPPVPDLTLLQMMFGLTPREAQTVADLARGCSVEESAHRRNVALSTVRSQLSSALSKTRAGTQAKLMLMLLALPALAGVAAVADPCD